MGTRLLLLCVIYQTVITEPLGGVTLPYTDVIGIVTPVKPKPFSPSTVSSSGISSSSLVCDSKDIIPKLFSLAPGTQELSLPLALTTSSRALPVPKIDSLSIADVKLPERLKEKFLSSKLRNAPIRSAKSDIGTPDVTLPYKNPSLTSSTTPQSALPSYSSWDMYANSLYEISSLSNIKSLPIVPIKPVKSSNTDVLCSESKSNNYLTQPSITPLSRTLDSPLTSEARKCSFSEQFNSNNFYPINSYSSPYPLYYKSMYLPGVKTPCEMLPLSSNLVSYKADDNIDFSNQSGSRNLLSLYTSDSSTNSLPGRNGLKNPIQTEEIPKPINTIQLPKTPSNIPNSIMPKFSAQTAATENLRSPLQANSGSAYFAFESKIIKPPQFLSSPVSKDCTDSKILRSSLPYLKDDEIPDCKLKPCTPPKIMPSALGMPDYTNVPGLEQIYFSNTFAPKTATHQQPLFTDECVTNTLKYSPPIIPLEPIPTISLGSSALSPITCFPPKISQTPSSISYINQCPSISIGESTSNIVSSINNLVSKIAQNILSSYKPYTDSVSPNVTQRPTYTTQSNPYDNPEFILKPTLPVLPLPQSNIVITEEILPILSLPIVLNPPDIETFIVSLDGPCKSSEFELPSCQPLLISSPQPTPTVLPPISSIIFSSPQLCPSYLPSPFLPSYPTIASPFYMETPVFKVTSKKDSDIEKLVELMLLAEILNNDESFDWDDLDTLLAFLSVR